MRQQPPAPQPKRIGMPVLLWWAVFLAATYAFSLLLQTFKAYTLTPDWSAGWSLVGALLLVVLTLGTLVYDSYAKEKIKGNLKKPFGPFEWLFAIQYKAPNERLDRGGETTHASVH